ncbi:hypothetical protein [Streptomyces sp. NPDC026589]|uniref:hypothetical protein n=1 Tax=Streptomyces sp. NPDC026589 TaxID=3155609 RepID=UPI0033DF03F0
MDDLRRRVYGSDHDDPSPYAEPGHEYLDLVGGPLDGLLLDVTGLTPEERVTGGALLITNNGAYGPGVRSDYEPRPGDPGRWHWQGDMP